MPLLGVNIDHVATVRQARRTYEPDPVWAAALAEMGGADGITLHLREDRRHISDRDLRVLRETVTVKLNLEMACEPEILAIACQAKPDQATLVPEKREEITTEGGLDICGQFDRVARAVDQLRRPASRSACFSTPIRGRSKPPPGWRSRPWNCTPGNTPRPCPDRPRPRSLRTSSQMGALVRQAGLNLHAGHGLTYRNVRPVAAIEAMHELNIGHSIVARAIMVGFEEAVREMKRLVS